MTYTDDQIRAMSDRELDAHIEAFLQEQTTEYHWEVIYEEALESHWWARMVLPVGVTQEVVKKPAHYSTNLTAAAQATDALAKQGWHLRINHDGWDSLYGVALSRLYATFNDGVDANAQTEARARAECALMAAMRMQNSVKE